LINDIQADRTGPIDDRTKSVVRGRHKLKVSNTATAKDRAQARRDGRRENKRGKVGRPRQKEEREIKRGKSRTPKAEGGERDQAREK
jgi:hypothetical protein